MSYRWDSAKVLYHYSGCHSRCKRKKPPILSEDGGLPWFVVVLYTSVAHWDFTLSKGGLACNSVDRFANLEAYYAMEAAAS